MHALPHCVYCTHSGVQKYFWLFSIYFHYPERRGFNLKHYTHAHHLCLALENFIHSLSYAEGVCTLDYSNLVIFTLYIVLYITSPIVPSHIVRVLWY